MSETEVRRGAGQVESVRSRNHVPGSETRQGDPGHRQRVRGGGGQAEARSAGHAQGEDLRDFTPLARKALEGFQADEWHYLLHLLKKIKGHSGCQTTGVVPGEHSDAVSKKPTDLDAL